MCFFQICLAGILKKKKGLVHINFDKNEWNNRISSIFQCIEKEKNGISEHKEKKKKERTHSNKDKDIKL